MNHFSTRAAARMAIALSTFAVTLLAIVFAAYGTQGEHAHPLVYLVYPSFVLLAAALASGVRGGCERLGKVAVGVSTVALCFLVLA